MFALLSEFIRNIGHSVTVIVMDPEHRQDERTHLVRPGQMLLYLGASFVTLFVVCIAVLLLTPLRYYLPGYGTLNMRIEARENKMRLESMADSLALQAEYVSSLRDIFLGNVDATPPNGDPAASAAPAFSAGSSLLELPLPTLSGNWEDHQQPAIAISRLSTLSEPTAQIPLAGPSYLSALSFPILPPVSGIITRGFDARTSHYAVDVAAETGSAIRSIGDGYVIFADWVNDGGQVIAIAHAVGYISVFKHNSSLLKQIGDRVRDREVIAFSGNSGEITSGPHAHFELWLDGLAQDPRAYVLGW